MKGLSVFCVLLLMATSVFAANFAPAPMKISSPGLVHYDFDGKTLNIPVTVNGVAGSGSFLVFTQGKGASIGEVTNGYLGWHHVNKIDTCIYASPFIQMAKGANTIAWDGKGEGGTAVPPGDYTYYIWAFDNVNMRIQMTKFNYILTWKYRNILTHDMEGKPLSNPVWYSQDYDSYLCFDKWVIGGDPGDSTLVEKTYVTGTDPHGSFAFDPKNIKYFFTKYQERGKITSHINKWEWVPNGSAIAQTTWGGNGNPSYTGFGIHTGVVSDSKDYLMFGTFDYMSTESRLVFVNASDGAEIKRFNLSPWWVDLEDGKAGGQNCGGPNNIIFHKNLLGLNSHTTCVNQLINPYYTDEQNAVVWTNTNGDYTGDHNYAADAAKKWVCNDFNTGVYKYNISMDAKLFMAFPSFNPPDVTSFGLYAPDGTGLGYHTFFGETALIKLAIEFIDYGSAYDGLYTTNIIEKQNEDQTVWYVGQDSFRGTITNQVGVAEAAPFRFVVSQNTPNPFNPSTTITFTLAEAGKTTVDVYNAAGQKVDTILDANLSAGSHSVTWDASRFSAGVYFYTIQSGKFLGTRKMTLLK